MSDNYWDGKIKVVGESLCCFPVDPVTLNAVGCGVYDPWAWTDPEPGPIETISVGEWNSRLNKKWDREMREERARRHDRRNQQ